MSFFSEFECKKNEIYGNVQSSMDAKNVFVRDIVLGCRTFVYRERQAVLFVLSEYLLSHHDAIERSE